VQGTAVKLASDIGVRYEAWTISVPVSTMAFYLRSGHQDGTNLYPHIRQVLAEDRVPDWNRVRWCYGISATS
jgi:hypothetical protein